MQPKVLMRVLRFSGVLGSQRIQCNMFHVDGQPLEFSILDRVVDKKQAKPA